jgi:hypothetical protein
MALMADAVSMVPLSDKVSFSPQVLSVVRTRCLKISKIWQQYQVNLGQRNYLSLLKIETTLAIGWICDLVNVLIKHFDSYDYS